MGYRNGKRAFMHAVQEDVGRGVRVRNLDHADSCFVLLREVRLEGRPAFCARYDALQLTQELAPVTYTEREGVFAFEESSELLADLLVVYNSRSPSSSGAEDIAVREASVCI